MKRSNDTQFASYREVIEREVGGFLPTSLDGAFLDSYIGRVPTAPWAHYNSCIEPVQDILSRGGKRWRSLLLLLISEAMGEDIQNPSCNPALPLVSLIELVHGGTLVVDDIEDQSDTRRGDVAVHLKYGEDVAINSGNFMYLAPLRIIEQYPFEKRVALYEVYQRLLTRLHIGQGLDIHWHRHPEIIPTCEQYYEMTRLKTGSLARMAAEMGSIVGAGDGVETKEIQQSLGDFADLMGVAFQIQDDILNITQGIEGKEFGDDLIEGKKSLPYIMAVEENPSIGKELASIIQQLQGDLPLEEQHTLIQSGVSLIIDNGGVDLATREFHRIKKELLKSVDQIANQVPQPKHLIDFIQQLLSL